MNYVGLLGNLTADPELRQSSSGVSFVTFTIAVQRFVAEKDGSRKADFIQCTAFGNNAINICKFFKKGSKILLQGEWRTDSYEQNGVRIYTNKMLVNRFSFTERLGANVDNNQSLSVPYQQTQNDQIRQDFEVPTMNEVPAEDFGFSTDDDFGF